MQLVATKLASTSCRRRRRCPAARRLASGAPTSVAPAVDSFYNGGYGSTGSMGCMPLGCFELRTVPSSPSFFAARLAQDFLSLDLGPRRADSKGEAAALRTLGWKQGRGGGRARLGVSRLSVRCCCAQAKALSPAGWPLGPQPSFCSLPCNATELEEPSPKSDAGAHFDVEVIATEAALPGVEHAA